MWHRSSLSKTFICLHSSLGIQSWLAVCGDDIFCLRMAGKMERLRSCHQSILACSMFWTSTYSVRSKMLQASFYVFLLVTDTVTGINHMLISVEPVSGVRALQFHANSIHNFTKCLWVLSLPWGLQTSRKNLLLRTMLLLSTCGWTW